MPLPRPVDTVLDRLVVPGYSRLGYAGWRALIVTGAAGGLVRRRHGVSVTIRLVP